MNSLSEYIPLLVILGFIVVSIRKGVVKAKQEEMSKTTLPGRRSGEEISIPEVLSVKKAKAKMKTTQTEPTVMRSSLVVPVETPAPEEEDLNASDALFIHPEEVEELQKAVIYTEILNRKEYF
jgi:hypothetical protein